MRRATTIVLVSLSVLTACTGAQAPEPYDGIVVATRSATPPVMRQAPASDAEPIASEVEVPWTIALLSDRRPPGRGRKDPSAAGPTVVVEHDVGGVELRTEDENADLEVVLNETEDADRPTANDKATVDDKPAPPPKVCPGLVHRRS